MLSRVNTVAFNGLEILDVDLQVQISSGLPAFTIVGLPDKAVAESRERVRAALQSLGLSLPAKRITLNLAPADLLKEGSHFDLPVALGLLAGMGVIPQEELPTLVITLSSRPIISPWANSDLTVRCFPSTASCRLPSKPTAAAKA